jgi:CheY-like chemotaxis protein
MINNAYLPMDGMNEDMDQRPRLLLVYSDSEYAARCSRYCRRHGWEVHLMTSGAQACELVGSLAPAVVVLDTGLPDDAWRTCAMITREHPGLPVVLVGTDASNSGDRLQQVGAAAHVTRGGPVEELAEQVFNVSFASAP